MCKFDISISFGFIETAYTARVTARTYIFLSFLYLFPELRTKKCKLIPDEHWTRKTEL